MIKCSYKLNDVYVDGYGYEHYISNKELLIEKCCNLEVGEGFDWNEFDDGEVLTSYRVDKIEWHDSVVILIGGYGGFTLSCYCESEKCCDKYDITETIKEFFDNRVIDSDEIILISK
ncbi:hypothetical protein SAMN05443270_3069 [Lacrimispora sphenoides]|uniref:hypothetical protein n=1 Tax=Lacrimispora sphenoides TaxID=29370 RepID=UPI0008C30CEC|nr:hypothetical protein [Lacrimispora sphenoides]SEU09192.1 hypothetical protein SAMN05443270_3069 [Lacrimispora sphenoides]